MDTANRTLSGNYAPQHTHIHAPPPTLLVFEKILSSSSMETWRQVGWEGTVGCSSFSPTILYHSILEYRKIVYSHKAIIWLQEEYFFPVQLRLLYFSIVFEEEDITETDIYFQKKLFGEKKYNIPWSKP